MNKELLFQTLRNTLLAALYILLVSLFMGNGAKLFGPDTLLTPFVILLLFSLSAAVVGSLVLGKSILLFLDGKKKESVLAAGYSIGWLAVYTVIGMLVLFFTK
jgi:hypothetical protein